MRKLLLLIPVIGLVVAYLRLRATLPEVVEEVEIPSVPVNLFGGPLDGQTVEVKKMLDWFVNTYLPDDLDGEPWEEFEEFGGMQFFKPNFAYYRKVTEDSFFYVRDITVREFQTALLTERAPEVDVRNGEE